MPVGLLRAPIARAPITSEESAAFTEAALARLRAGALKLKTPLDSGLIRSLEKAPFPELKPAFGRMLVDRTGALWLSTPLAGLDSEDTWNVFAPEGTWLGVVTTPAGLRVDEIGADYLLGVWNDSEGKSRVRMYPVVRDGGS
jgi:hypothetical protein